MEWGDLVAPGGVTVALISAALGIFSWWGKRKDLRLAVADGPFGQMKSLLEDYRKRIDELEQENERLRVESRRQSEELRSCQMKLAELSQLIQAVQTEGQSRRGETS